MTKQTLSRTETHDLEHDHRGSHQGAAGACRGTGSGVHGRLRDARWRPSTPSIRTRSGRRRPRQRSAWCDESQKTIAKRCKELGIPPTFAPSISVPLAGPWRERAGGAPRRAAPRGQDLDRGDDEGRDHQDREAGARSAHAGGRHGPAVTRCEDVSGEPRADRGRRCACSTSARSSESWRRSSSCGSRIGGGCMAAMTNGDQALHRRRQRPHPNGGRPRQTGKTHDRREGHHNDQR